MPAGTVLSCSKGSQKTRSKSVPSARRTRFVVCSEPEPRSCSRVLAFTKPTTEVTLTKKRPKKTKPNRKPNPSQIRAKATQPESQRAKTRPQPKKATREAVNHLLKNNSKSVHLRSLVFIWFSPQRVSISFSVLQSSEGAKAPSPRRQPGNTST